MASTLQCVYTSGGSIKLIHFASPRGPRRTRRCELDQMELQVHSWLREARTQEMAVVTDHGLMLTNDDH